MNFVVHIENVSTFQHVILLSKDLTQPGRQAENPHEIAVVTIYIHPERFQKGNGDLRFPSDTYKKKDDHQGLADQSRHSTS